MTKSTLFISAIFVITFLISVSASGENSTPQPSPSPTKPPVVCAIAAGYNHSLALKTDGRIWVWGGNEYRQLGVVAGEKTLVPVQVQSISDVKAISAGMYYSLALKTDGTVWAWGTNDLGQLGDATYEKRDVPVMVKGLTEIVAICAGAVSAYAIKSDGTLYAWGANSEGQIGIGSFINRNLPARIGKISPVRSVSCNNRHVVALSRNGSIYVWGENKQMQLGKITEGAVPDPFDVYRVELDEPVSASAGDITLVVRKNGSVWALGWNSLSQTGDGTDARKAFYKGEPQQVGGLSGIVKVSCDSHYLALDKKGFVFAWGENMHGQTGNGQVLPNREASKIESLSSIIEIDAGRKYSLALDANGVVWAWGCNSSGQLGDATIRDRQMPIKVMILADDSQ